MNSHSDFSTSKFHSLEEICVGKGPHSRGRWGWQWGREWSLGTPGASLLCRVSLPHLGAIPGSGHGRRGPRGLNQPGCWTGTLHTSLGSAVKGSPNLGKVNTLASVFPISEMGLMGEPLEIPEKHSGRTMAVEKKVVWEGGAPSASPKGAHSGQGEGCRTGRPHQLAVSRLLGRQAPAALSNEHRSGTEKSKPSISSLVWLGTVHARVHQSSGPAVSSGEGRGWRL